jgi:Zn-dependent protease with chaperone function
VGAGPTFEREDEPEFFAFADLLADKVGCPRPTIIQLCLQANAAASWKSSLFGLNREGFTLILGLPLIAGLTVSQLAGVMSHEFGHFSQKKSALLDRLIRRVNVWMAVAVHRRDVVDMSIQASIESGHIFLVLLGLLVWVLLNLGRLFLWLLMQTGLLASASLLRRMEFDADCYEIGLVGSSEFVQTSRRVIALSIAQEHAFRYAFSSLQVACLPCDLAVFTADLADRSPRVKKKTQKMIDDDRASWLASHPPTRSRIRAAKELNRPGVFQCPIPGSVLFRDFQKICESVTIALYAHRYGRALTPDMIRPTKEAADFYLEFVGSKGRRA